MALSAADIATLKKFLGPINAKSAGAGETCKIGAVMPFSTSGSVYGEVFRNGAKLAVDHIKQLGGPDIQIDFRDSAGSDVAKARNAFVAFASLPAVLSSYEAAGTIAKDLIAKNHNFSIDPGGGNAPPGEGVPYYWGMRANWGIDGFKLQRHLLRPATEEAEGGERPCGAGGPRLVLSLRPRPGRSGPGCPKASTEMTLCATGPERI